MYNKGGQQSGEYSLLPTCHYLTVGEIANFTGFRYETVRRWLKMGLLEGVLIRHRWRVSRTVFVQFWEEHRVEELE